MNAKKIGQKVLFFPLTKIIIGLIVVGAIVTIGNNGSNMLLNNISISEDLKKLIDAIVIGTLSIFSYYVLYKYYEKRTINELSSNKIASNLLLGIYIGFGLQSLNILVMYLSGTFKVFSINSVSFLLPALAMAISSATLEEILFRGIIFRIIQEKLGSYLALIASAVIFGALHLGNPNSTFITALGLAIQAGLLLGVVYIYSGSLWLPIAIHFAWNFTQTGIYGAIVSGISFEKSLLTTEINGPDWITGGQFGPEGSLEATLFSLVVTTVFLILIHKQNKIVKPFWKK